MGDKFSSTKVSYTSLATMARAAYDLSEGYEVVFAALGGTLTGDADLCDADGDATAADKDLIALRDELIEYVKTTMARHDLAGLALENNLRDYQDADEETARDLEYVFTDWEAHGYGHSEDEWDAEEHAEATDRPAEANEETHPDYYYDELGGGN